MKNFNENDSQVDDIIQDINASRYEENNLSKIAEEDIIQDIEIAKELEAKGTTVEKLTRKTLEEILEFAKIKTDKWTAYTKIANQTNYNIVQEKSNPNSNFKQILLNMKLKVVVRRQFILLLN